MSRHSAYSAFLRRVLATLVVIVCTPASAEIFVGHCRDRLPYLDADQKTCEGPVADIIEIALAKIGRSIDWLEVPWKRTIIYAKSGQVDIVPRHSMTPEREEFLDAVAYGHQRRELIFMVLGSSNIQVTRYEDLDGLKIGMLRGSYYSDQLDNDNRLEKVELDTSEQIISMLERGRIDVGVTSSAHELHKFL